MEYSTSRLWRSKLAEDLAAVAALAQEGFTPEAFVFCTNRHIDATVERQLVSEVRQRYGWELRLFGSGDLAVPLDTAWQDIRRRHLHIGITQHNWASLLAACDAQRQKVLARYLGKYDPALYVARRVEQTVGQWYQQAVNAMSKGPVPEQLLILVDRAGAGKSNLVLHLAEEYGTAGPVLVFPGSVTIADDHALEREIAAAVGYPFDARSYQADLEHILRLAENEGLPLFVVLDGVNESRDPHRIRNAVTQLLTAYRGCALLVLMTCRDALWAHIQDPVWRSFAYQPKEARSDDMVVPVGLFDDREFLKARDRWFGTHHVTAQLGRHAVDELRLPLLLRIFAEISSDQSLGIVTNLAIDDLWEKYFSLKVSDVSEALGHRLHERAISSSIESIALHMLEKKSHSLTRIEISTISHIYPEDTSESSLMHRLIDASVLVEDSSDSIHFLHDAFYNFVAGRGLASRLDDLALQPDVFEQVEQLASDHRWGDILVHAAARAATPDLLIGRILPHSIWVAARALRRSGPRVTAQTREQVVRTLIARLDSRYELDRNRAAATLGRLGSAEAIPALWRHAYEARSASAARALVRLGNTEVVDLVVEYLGRGHPFYLTDDQESLDSAPEAFRAALAERAIALLDEPERSQAAIRTLGYLRAPDGVEPIANHLVAAYGQDAVALVALLRIGTQSALSALEQAIGLAGELACAHRQVARTAEAADDQATAKEYDDRAGNVQHVLTELRLYGFQQSSPEYIEPFLLPLLQHPAFDVRLIVYECCQGCKLGRVALAVVGAVELCDNAQRYPHFHRLVG